MKKITITFIGALALLCLFAFTWTSNVDYKQMLDEQTRSEFLYATTSQELKTNLQSLYTTLFDEISHVDVHYASEGDYGYYYTAYGSKDGETVVNMVLISKKMAERQVFPSLKSLDLDASATYIPCYLKIKRITPFKFKISCTTEKTTYPVCGYSPSGDLCVSTNGIDIDQLPLPQ